MLTKILNGVAVQMSADEEADIRAQWAANVSRESPNVQGFIQALKQAMGGIVASNALAKAYPLFYSALELGQFADAQALIVDARTGGVLNDIQYAAFKQLVAKYSLPIVLA